MTCAEIVFAIVGIIVALVIGIGQIYIAKRVKDFETRQDARDEKRRSEQIYSEATRFIQKYSQNTHESEIYLLPLCVAAYKYNPVYPYRREIYREFCTLTEEVQNEIIKRFDFDIRSERTDTYYSDMLKRIIDTIRIYYDGDADGRYFYDNGKYLERALTNHGTELVPDDLRCEIDEDEKQARKNPVVQAFSQDEDDKMDFVEHLTNLLAYHKNEKPLSALLGYFQQNDEIIASYICCLIARYTAIYNYEECETDEEINLGYDGDYNGTRYMEDIFLDALNTVEHYHTAKE